jgi:hypothetical protein
MVISSGFLREGRLNYTVYTLSKWNIHFIIIHAYVLLFYIYSILSSFCISHTFSSFVIMYFCVQGPDI